MSSNALDAHGHCIADPDKAQALRSYRAHPFTAMLGLRIQYRDALGWKTACAARHDREMARIRDKIAVHVHA
jgi:hypothetical protein